MSDKSCPLGKIINADLNGAVNILHIPESHTWDRGNGLEAQPVAYRWTSRTGWVKPTNNEAMRMKAVNQKPMNHPRGTLAHQDGKEVRILKLRINYILINDYPRSDIVLSCGER